MGTNRIKSVERGMEILDHIRLEGESGVSEMARNLGMSKSSVHNYVSTMERRGYLRQTANGKYALGLKLFWLGGTARHRNSIHPSIKPIVKEIAHETGQSVSYACEVDGRLMFADLLRGTEAIQTEVYPGWSEPLQNLPEGRLILANLPEERRESIIEELTFPTAAGQSESGLREELKGLGSKTILTSHGNVVEGVSTISQPVYTRKDTFAGIVMIAVPSDATGSEKVETYSSLLKQKMARFKVNVRYGGY